MALRKCWFCSCHPSSQVAGACPLRFHCLRGTFPDPPAKSNLRSYYLITLSIILTALVPNSICLVKYNNNQLLIRMWVLRARTLSCPLNKYLVTDWLTDDHIQPDGKGIEIQGRGNELVPKIFKFPKVSHTQISKHFPEILQWFYFMTARRFPPLTSLYRLLPTWDRIKTARSLLSS